MKHLFAAVSSAALLTTGAMAATVTFNDLAPGSVVTELDVPGQPGVKLATVSVSNNSVVVFDTEDTNNPNDDDLQKDIELNGVVTSFGNVLIIGSGGNTPNDRPRGGTVTFDFEKAVTAVSIDVIDITGDVEIILRDLTGTTELFRQVFNVDLDTPEDNNPNTNNLAETLFFGPLGVTGVGQFVISYRESGAFDNLRLADIPDIDQPIPVPAALPLLVTGAAALRLAKGRKRR